VRLRVERDPDPAVVLEINILSVAFDAVVVPCKIQSRNSV
jgi:hypothetical protein